MERFIIIFAIIFGICIFGCGRKEQAQESLRPLTMEELTAIETVSTAPESEPEEAQKDLTEADLEPLPPPGPYKPSARDIQRALKIANFYKGEIDGKIGPMSKKAIREFQEANGLKVDGIVGPKTWEVLRKYLQPESKTTGP